MTKGETIRTENSLKYGPRDACVLLRAGDWSPLAAWGDQQELFSLILANNSKLVPPYSFAVQVVWSAHT